MLENIKQYLNYNPITGNFLWIKQCGGKGMLGCIAGTKHKNGYVYIRFNNKKYAAHQLAFYFMTGKLIKNIDHINRIKYDNRWKNIRESTHSMNNFNKKTIKSKNYYMPRGVSPHKNKFMARCKKDKKSYFLGYFDTPEKAHAAYKQKAIELYKNYATKGVFSNV